MMFTGKHYRILDNKSQYFEIFEIYFYHFSLKLEHIADFVAFVQPIRFFYKIHPIVESHGALSTPFHIKIGNF